MTDTPSPPSTALVAGAGLVGALSAAMLASRGYTVTIIEARTDPRLAPASGSSTGARARSINLALSPRGIEALRSVSEELVERVLKEGIEMRGRMLHKKGKGGRVEKEGQDYGYYGEGECIRSISRTTLGNFLLDHLDGLPKEGRGSVRVLFGTKLVEMDLRKEGSGSEVVLATKEDGERREHFDLVVGADGAYSRVRREMMRGSKTRFNFSQSYAPHSYLELSIPPGPADPVTGRPTFSIEPGYLHIWPRGEFMLIALANKDTSFTLTLFAHSDTFDTIDKQVAKDPKAAHPAVELFRAEFPDALALMGEDELVRAWTEHPKDGLITVQCAPYHYKDKVILLGDAAHAMVPFYGQGMNCGFEDVRFLSSLLDHFRASPSPLVPSPLPVSATSPPLPHPDSTKGTPLAQALSTYTRLRTPSLAAIQQLAAHNYDEMAASVLDPLYLVRLALDRSLNQVFRTLGRLGLTRKEEGGQGGVWDSLYRMVTFKYGVAYEEAQRRRAWQQAWIEGVAKGVAVTTVGLVGWAAWTQRGRLSR